MIYTIRKEVHKMMTVKEAEQYLKKEIGPSVDMKNVWEAFKKFAMQEIEDEDDVELLFQCGMREDMFFYVDFVRQFTIYEGEEYSHMEQLHCELVFESKMELKDLVASEWYFETEEGVEEYFLHIESLEEFKLPLTHKPISVKVYQQEI